MNRVYLSILAAGALAGCSHVATHDLTSDRVFVQANAFALQWEIDEEAQRGCQIHGRTAVPVSVMCIDRMCQFRQHLYACQADEA